MDLAAGIGRLAGDPPSLLAGLVGVLTFLSLVSLWRALIEERPRASRVRAVARRRLQVDVASGRARRRGRLRPREGLLGLAARQARLMQASQAERIGGSLARAGFRSREAVAAFVGAKLLCPAAGALAALALAYAPDGAVPPAARLAMACALAAASFFLPEIYVANLAAKRRRALQQGLPDALDLMVICAEAGLTLDTALHRVSEELSASAAELADELAVTAVELNFLPERRQALQNLAKRVNLPALRGVVGTLVQTERYGTPLAQSLRVLAADFREQRMLRAEEKAARLPATLTVPMIVFILPTLFVVLIGPALLDVIDRMAK